MATVREMARLLAGLPETWQDIGFCPAMQFPYTGVDLVTGTQDQPAEVHLTNGSSPTVSIEGVINPPEEFKLWPVHTRASHMATICPLCDNTGLSIHSTPAASGIPKWADASGVDFGNTLDGFRHTIHAPHIMACTCFIGRTWWEIHMGRACLLYPGKPIDHCLFR